MVEAQQVPLFSERGVASESGQPFIVNTFRRISLIEQAIVVFTLFLLAYRFPNDWFRFRTDGDDINLGGGVLVQLVYLPLFLFLISRVSTNLAILAQAVRREAYLSLFVLWIVASSLWSAEPSATFRRSIAVALTALFAICLGIRFERRHLLGMFVVVLMMGTALNLFFVFGLPRYGVGVGGTWDGIYVAKNQLGRHETMSFMVYATAAGIFLRYRLRLVLLAALSAMLVVGSESATSQIALLGVAANLWIFRTFRARGTLFGAVVISFLVTAVAAVSVVFANLGPITAIFNKDVTFTGRTDLWLAVIPDVLERPFLGVGYDGYWRGYFSPSHEVWVDLPWLPPHAHNAFLDYMLTIGLIGCLLIVVVFVRGIVRGAQLVRLRRDSLSVFPVIVLLYSLVFSLSEQGVVGRHLRFVMFVVAIQAVAEATLPENRNRGRIQEFRRRHLTHGPQELDPTN